MKLKSLVSACLLGVAAFSAPAQAQVEIQWWHAMGGSLGEWVNDLAKGFNDSQKDYKVVPTYKGTYPETLTAGIAAFRAGNAPDILQVFEVGTATMMASKGAIVPVGKVMKDSGLKFDPAGYVPAVAGYYTAPNGQMLSLPFNSSTTIFYYNKDAFKAAGLNPDKPPSTWPEVALAAAKLKASGHACPFTTSWISWTQLESFSAWHNVEFASKQNGLGGMDTRLVFNGPLLVRHIENLANMAKQGLFVYKGREQQVPDAAFISGECAMIDGRRSSTYGAAEQGREVRVRHSRRCPTTPTCPGAPQNTDHRRREPVGDERASRRPITTRASAAFFELPVEPSGAGREPPAHRLPADHESRLRADGRESGFYQEEPGHRRRREPDDPKDHRQVARRAPGQLRADPGDRSTRSSSRSGRARRRAKEGLDEAVKRGNEQLLSQASRRPTSPDGLDRRLRTWPLEKRVFFRSKLASVGRCSAPQGDRHRRLLLLAGVRRRCCSRCSRQDTFGGSAPNGSGSTNFKAHLERPELSRVVPDDGSSSRCSWPVLGIGDFAPARRLRRSRGARRGNRVQDAADLALRGGAGGGGRALALHLLAQHRHRVVLAARDAGVNVEQPAQQPNDAMALIVMAAVWKQISVQLPLLPRRPCERSRSR